jgi:TonB family protein
VAVLLLGAGAIAFKRWGTGGPELAVKKAAPATVQLAPDTSRVRQDTAPPAAAVAAPETATLAAPAAATVAEARPKIAEMPRSAGAPKKAAPVEPVGDALAAKESGTATTTVANFDTTTREADVTTVGRVDDVAQPAAAPVASLKSAPLASPNSTAAANLNSIAARNLTMSRALQMKKAFFENHITDVNNQPISFASVRLLPAGHELSADQNGFFRLGTTDTTARVLVTAVGYTPRQFGVGELKSLQTLQLIQDSTLMEKVVVGTAKRKSLRQRETLDSTGAQPLEGWGTYNDYLTNNLQLPDEALHNHIHGEVDLNFQVDETGKPTNVSVTKSLCNSCDAEAVRLLLQGPGWQKAKEGKKVKGKLKVHF